MLTDDERSELEALEATEGRALTPRESVRWQELDRKNFTGPTEPVKFSTKWPFPTPAEQEAALVALVGAVRRSMYDGPRSDLLEAVHELNPAAAETIGRMLSLFQAVEAVAAETPGISTRAELAAALELYERS